MTLSSDQEYSMLPPRPHDCVDTDFEDETLTSNVTVDSALLEKDGFLGPQTIRTAKLDMATSLNIAFFLISVISLTMGLLWRADIDRQCVNLHSEYSPALKDIDLSYKRVKFNGTLDHPSIYRGNPSPAIDDAWDYLENVRPMSITEDELLKLGKSTDAIKVPAQFGGGYIASVELNHQLHCLNFLRKSTFSSYYTPPSPFASVEFTDQPEIVATHQGHCIEMLRQFIMCHADVGIITHRWVKDYPRPYPDFNTWHQCRNFDSALQWTKEKEWKDVDGGLPKGWTFTPGEGEVILDVPP